MNTKNILSTAFTAIFAIVIGLSSVNAQTTTTVVNGVSFQYNAMPGASFSGSYYANQCFIDPALWVGAIQFGVAGSGSSDLIITTPTPVYSLQFLLGAVSHNGQVNSDKLHILSLNSPTNLKDVFTSGGLLVNGCLQYVAGGNSRNVTVNLNNVDGNGYVTITSKTPFTKANLMAYGDYMVISTVPSTVTYCSVGTTAPALSGTTISNGTNCVTETVNLNSLHTGTAPGTSSLVWFTNNTASGYPYPTPTAAAAGTYYAFYFDGANGGCYSPASTAVTATTTTCAACDSDAGTITITP